MSLSTNIERQRGGVDFMLHRAAELYPTRTAVIDNLNQVSLDYATLRARAVRLARGLEALGVSAGEPVAYVFFNEATALEIVFACTLLGAVAMPINNRLAPPEGRDYLRRQHVQTLIVREEFIPFAEGTEVTRLIVRGPQVPPHGISYAGLIESASDKLFPPRASWEKPYMVVMTGGTTGGSKAATLTHGGALFDMLSIINHWSISPGCRSLVYAPMFHAGGLGWATMPILWQAGTLILPPSTSFDPDYFLRTVIDYPVDAAFLVPAMVDPIYQAWDGNPITSLRSLSLASAAVPEPLRVKLAEMFPTTDSLVCYGMTETYSITMQQPEDFTAHPASSGHAALVARVRIVDEAGFEVPRGTVGQVVSRSFGQSLYYAHDPDNTAATFKKLPDDPQELEWTHTGDLGFMDEEGRVTLVDRAKDVIISGGENVPSIEVEVIIGAHPAIRECAVVGQPDERWGEVVVAVLVCGGADVEQVGREVCALCRENLADYKNPRRYVFLEELPRSAVGKVLKHELRATTFAESYDRRIFEA